MNEVAQVARQIFSIFCKIKIRLLRFLFLSFLIICIIVVYTFDFINKFIT